MNMTIEERLQRMELLLVVGLKNVLDTNEVALLLGVTNDHVRHLVCQRAIPHYKKGSRTYFKKSEIENWQLARRVATADELRMKGATRAATTARR